MSNIPRYQEKYEEIYLALFCYQIDTWRIHTSNVKPWPRAPSYFTKSTATSKQIVKSAELSTIHRYVFQVYRFQDIPRKKAAICPSLVSATTKRLWLRASSNVGTRRCFFHEVSIPKKKVLQTAGGYSITNLTNYIPSVSETLENWFWRVLLVKSCQILSGTEQHHNIHCQELVPWNSWNIKLLRPGMSRAIKTIKKH